MKVDGDDYAVGGPEAKPVVGHTAEELKAEILEATKEAENHMGMLTDSSRTVKWGDSPHARFPDIGVKPLDDYSKRRISKLGQEEIVKVRQTIDVNTKELEEKMDKMFTVLSAIANKLVDMEDRLDEALRDKSKKSPHGVSPPNFGSPTED